MLWFEVSDWLGIIPIVIAFFYGITGLIQLIQYRNIKKVNPNIIALGVFYIIIIGLYIFFETITVNYRPILMNGILERSYPSTHIFVSTCILFSAVLINRNMMFDNLFRKILEIIFLTLLFIIVIGRLLSGVHWATDLFGGLLLSIGLLSLFYTLLQIQNARNK